MPFTQDILSAAGSSPRMRGSLFGSLCKHILKGIIPAHAGLTLTKVARILDLRDHPRACGAHPLLTTSSTVSRGSSPRMRGSHGFCDADVRVMGIIPAHAGLTWHAGGRKREGWDHPRACGAHLACRRTKTRRVGSSPRMRGSRRLSCWPAWLRGIIPAHAGLTWHRHDGGMRHRDHPRACGAHKLIIQNCNATWGSSPRMRGSPPLFSEADCRQGIIPAHAGLTESDEAAIPLDGDHPRACGAHAAFSWSKTCSLGSSPRMRGSHLSMS